MLILCFEDENVTDLSPITHARPAYAITCAGYRLVDWLRRLQSDSSLAGGEDPGGKSKILAEVRDYLVDIQTEDFDIRPIPKTATDFAKAFGGENDFGSDDVLMVNARLVPSVRNFEGLAAIARQRRFSVIIQDGDEGDVEPEDASDDVPKVGGAGGAQVLAAWIPADEVRRAMQSHLQRAQAIAERASGTAPRQRSKSRPPVELGATAVLVHHAASAVRAAVHLDAFRWPHDVVLQHMACMNESIEHRISNGNFTQLEDGVFVGEGVSIGQYESIHTSGGAIILDDRVRVGPFCFLEGPLYAGPDTRVIEHSSIKDGVSLGHTTKIGGEVEASVIEPYTNKQHHGFLGHSYLGSWINLGAGTCNSDLKNTYGKINIEYGDRKIATGMQFLGCIMGDYSKSAINTGIFTGKVIGVCSMMYGFVTGNVPSYVNYARLFGQTSLLPPEVMVNTQARMFARRKFKQRPIDIELIHAMYHQTEAERRLSDQLGF